MVGCERCMMDYGCEIEVKAAGDLQAFYQCPHALLPLNDSTGLSTSKEGLKNKLSSSNNKLSQQQTFNKFY